MPKKCLNNAKSNGDKISRSFGQSSVVSLKIEWTTKKVTPMDTQIKLVQYETKQSHSTLMQRFSLQKAQEVLNYHQSLPVYNPTPLKELKSFANHYGINHLWVKDESYRFGLNAFKALGSSYCMATLLGERLGLSNTELSFNSLTTPEAKKCLGELTFVTATDGNHGRGVAWSAKTLGHKSIVLMPKGTAIERLENIKKLGADASITDFPYDDTVQMAARLALEKGGILVQDTAWAGYEEIPTRIMQGYLSLGMEIVNQLNGLRPTHVFLQAGVGSMAAAVAAFFAQQYGKNRPKIIIVEPHGANCLYRTAQANDGKIHAYEGELHSIMAGLCCGIPCTVAWELMQECSDYFVSMPDFVAADGMRILSAPMNDDPRIISGESGASCFGLVADLLRKPQYQDIKNSIGLGSDSNILCLSTEGDTDQTGYRKVVWDGAYSSI